MSNNVNEMQSSNSAGMNQDQSYKFDFISHMEKVLAKWPDQEKANRIRTGGPFWSSYWNAIIINKNGDMWILDDQHGMPTIGE